MPCIGCQLAFAAKALQVEVLLYMLLDQKIHKSMYKRHVLDGP
jgi:hypothetical protein